MNPAWCDNRGNLIALLAWLDTRGDLHDWKPGDYVYYLEKPWKWEPEWLEYQQWLADLATMDAA